MNISSAGKRHVKLWLAASQARRKCPAVESHGRGHLRCGMVQLGTASRVRICSLNRWGGRRRERERWREYDGGRSV